MSWPWPGLSGAGRGAWMAGDLLCRTAVTQVSVMEPSSSKHFPSQRIILFNEPSKSPGFTIKVINVCPGKAEGEQVPTERGVAHKPENRKRVLPSAVHQQSEFTGFLSLKPVFPTHRSSKAHTLHCKCTARHCRPYIQSVRAGMLGQHPRFSDRYTGAL